MKRLNREAYQRAREFLLTQARPLERTLFATHFEDGERESVFDELARFQNADGGYGRALEPDVRTPSSSALATGIALALLRELDCPAGHPQVSRAVRYLQKTFDENARVWRVVPLNTNDHPHAPWWHDENGSLARAFDGFRVIPRALILASFWHYAPLVPGEWLNDLTEETVSYIETVEAFGEGGGSDLEYTVGLAEAQNLPSSYAARLKARILRDLPVVVERDPEKWSGYCITPLRAVRSPNAPGADCIPEALQMHLDYQIEHQSADGAWDPTWSWGGFYPDTWPQARQEWRGHLTLETLMNLHAFGRMVG